MRGRKIGSVEVISGVALLVSGASLFKSNYAPKPKSERLHETRVNNRSNRYRIHSELGYKAYLEQWKTDLAAEESALAEATKAAQERYKDYFDSYGSYEACLERAYLEEYKAKLAEEMKMVAKYTLSQIVDECQKSHGKGDSCTKKI